MKILHTSDWHLGQTLRNYDREDEHRNFLRQLAEIISDERPDVLAVCGDVFHNAVPTIGAQMLFVEALRDLHRASPETVIVIIAGNHDSGSRLEIYRDLWLDHNVHIVGRLHPEHSVITLPEGKGVVIAIPYQSRVHFSESASSDSEDTETTEANPFNDLISQAAEGESPLVVMAHMAMGNDRLTKTIGGLDLLPLSSIPEGYDFLALGHIHRPGAVSSRAVYCGSPFPMTFDEDYPHYVNIVEIPRAGTTPELRSIEIKPLRRVVTVEAESPDAALLALAALPDDAEDYVRVVIETDNLLPADIEDRCRLILKDTAYRFCGCTRKSTADASKAGEEIPEMEIEDFIRISPLDVARRYFEDENIPDSEALLRLLAPLVEGNNSTEIQS